MITESYTWKEEYNLPLESKWSRIAKFCFLNGFSWSYVFLNKKIKNYIFHNLDNDILHGLPKYMLENNISDYKICPKCMEYGYHSYLHQLNGIDYCFLHKTQLIKMPTNQIYESKDGTYKFMSIHTEMIVKNKAEKQLIAKFISEWKVTGIICSRIICSKYDENFTYEFYKSTLHLFQKQYLNQNHLKIKNIKCIKSYFFEDIDVENIRLANEFLNSYVEFKLINGTTYFPKNIINTQERYEYIKRIFMYPSSHIAGKLSNDTLGWCMTKVMLDTINKLFVDYEDWEETFISVNRKHSNIKNLNSKDLVKYAVVLAFEAITTSNSYENAFCFDSSRWDHNSYYNCSFQLDIRYELNSYVNPFVGKKQYYNKATQYIIFPIIKDLFSDLCKQAYNMLYLEKIDLKLIDSLKPTIWKAPQYEIFYYKDKVSIYRCDPELDE